MNRSRAPNATPTRTNLFACTALCALVTGCASSSPFSSANNFDQTFIGAAQTWDLDKNSSVTCQEWQTYVSTLFKEHDTNGDNILNTTEFTAMGRTDRLFDFTGAKYYDANSDGNVTFNEIAGKPNRAFALLDKNGDCQIDRTESVRVHGLARAPAKAKKAPDGATSTPGPGGR